MFVSCVVFAFDLCEFCFQTCSNNELSQPSNQSINKPINQSTNQSNNQSVNQSASQSVSQSPKQATKHITAKKTNKKIHPLKTKTNKNYITSLIDTDDNLKEGQKTVYCICVCVCVCTRTYSRNPQVVVSNAICYCCG